MPLGPAGPLSCAVAVFPCRAGARVRQSGRRRPRLAVSHGGRPGLISRKGRFMMASWLDWTSQDFYSHLVVAGLVLVVVAIVLYALPGARLKVPGIALSIVGSLGAGLALGIILMAS